MPQANETCPSSPPHASAIPLCNRGRGLWIIILHSCSMLLPLLLNLTLLTQVTAFGVVNSNGQTGNIPTGMNFAFGGGQTPVNGAVSPDSQLPSQAGGKASAMGLGSSKDAAAPGSDDAPKVTPSQTSASASAQTEDNTRCPRPTVPGQYSFAVSIY